MGYDAFVYKVKRINKDDSIIIRNETDTQDVLKALSEKWNSFNSVDCGSWCSNGRYWVDFVYDNIDKQLRGKADYQEILIRTPTDYAELCRVTSLLMQTVDYQFSKVLFSMNQREDDGSFKCTPVDGVMVECEDGSIRQVWNEYDDGFLIPNSDATCFTTVWEFVQCVFSAANTNWETEVLLLGGGY